jgi:hypothetical protein
MVVGYLLADLRQSVAVLNFIIGLAWYQ